MEHNLPPSKRRLGVNDNPFLGIGTWRTIVPRNSLRPVPQIIYAVVCGLTSLSSLIRPPFIPIIVPACDLCTSSFSTPSFSRWLRRCEIKEHFTQSNALASDIVRPSFNTLYNGKVKFKNQLYVDGINTYKLDIQCIS